MTDEPFPLLMGFKRQATHEQIEGLTNNSDFHQLRAQPEERGTVGITTRTSAPSLQGYDDLMANYAPDTAACSPRDRSGAS